jgi:hypothetical protein
MVVKGNEQMNETLEKFIAETAKELKESVEGSSLYGEVINMDDPNHILVAVYFKQQYDHLARVLESMADKF